MRQIVSRSDRRGNVIHLLDPLVDDRPGIVRAGTCFRVELDGARALAAKLEAFDGAVVQGRMCDLWPSATAKP